MPWIKIGPNDEPKILFNVGSGGPSNHSFLPGDVNRVMDQNDVNAFQIVPAKLIAAQLSDIDNDLYCYALIGVRVEGPLNSIIKKMINKDDVVALPCPPLNNPDGTEIK